MLIGGGVLKHAPDWQRTSFRAIKPSQYVGGKYLWPYNGTAPAQGNGRPGKSASRPVSGAKQLEQLQSMALRTSIQLLFNGIAVIKDIICSMGIQ